VPNYLGNAPLLAHMMQIFNGVTPGGMPALLDLFKRHKVRPDEVVQALEDARIGGPDTVADFVAKNPLFADWYSKTRPTPKAQVIRYGDSYFAGFRVDNNKASVSWNNSTGAFAHALLFIPTVPPSTLVDLEAHGFKREDIEILTVSVA